jgi:hypothetical protein
MLQAKRLHCPGNRVKVFASHGYIDISCEAAGVGVSLFDVEVRGESADYAIIDPGGGESVFHHPGEREELFHPCLEE